MACTLLDGMNVMTPWACRNAKSSHYRWTETYHLVAHIPADLYLNVNLTSGSGSRRLLRL